MPASTEESRPVLAWLNVLEQIQSALDGPLARAPQEDAAAPEPADHSQALQRVDDRLARLQSSLDQAERNAAVVDAALAAEAEEMRRWVEDASKLRRRVREQTEGDEAPRESPAPPAPEAEASGASD
jgi:hypothetical protein